MPVVGTMRALALLLALPLVLAGCMAPDTVPNSGSGAPEATVRALETLELPPCEAEVGEGTSDNLVVLDQYVNEEGSWGEADIRGDLALVARNAQGGFHLVDVSDPTNLTHVSTWDDPGRRALDIKWTATGDGAVIGDFGQIQMVDLADPANPVLRHTFQYNKSNPRMFGQAHMVQPYLIEGVEYVFVATQTNNEPMHVLKREGWNLTWVSSIGLDVPVVGAPVPVVRSTPLGNHDPYILNDEMYDDKPLLYLSDGLAGWAVFDVSDPTAPTRVGGSLNLDPWQGYVHTIRVGFMDQKRIVVTMQEVGHNAVKIWDATDLENPVLMGAWTADKTKPNHPNHNIQLVKDHLYLAHYSQGVYVFDLASDIKKAPDRPLGVELHPIAHLATPSGPQADAPLWFNGVWEVLVDDGIIYVGDRVIGLFSVAFSCITPGDPTETSFG